MKLKRTLRKVAELGIGMTAVAALLLAGCNGGGSGGGGSTTPATSTLGGVAAVGFPIANGTINVSCAAGSALSTTTGSAGAWLVTLTGQTLPCAVQLTGGTINGASNPTLYHSIATAAGTVNVTPLTDLMVANLTGTATPSVWFSGLSATTLTAITQANVDAALAKLRTALSGLPPLGTINPITTAFTPAPGNAGDDILTALKIAMTNTGVTHTALLSNASIPTFTAFVTGFSSALTTAYSGTTSGGGTTGGLTGGTTRATAACNSTAAPAGMNYSQSGNTLTVTTTGCIPVPTDGMCSPSAPQATGINVLMTGTVSSFSMTGIAFNMPGMPDPFASVGSALSAVKQCIANAPAELSNLNINFNVCYDMTSQMASSVASMQSSGIVTVTNPITGRAQGAVAMQTVADCTTSGADTITDAFTGKVKVKQPDGSYRQIN